MKKISLYILLIVLIGACANPNKKVWQENPEMEKYSTPKKEVHYNKKSYKNKKEIKSNKQKLKEEKITDKDLKSIAKQKIQQALELKLLWQKADAEEKNNIEKLERKVFAKQKNGNLKKQLNEERIKDLDSIKVIDIQQVSIKEIDKNSMLGKYQIKYQGYRKGRVVNQSKKEFKIYFKIDELYLDDKILKVVDGRVLVQ